VPCFFWLVCSFPWTDFFSLVWGGGGGAVVSSFGRDRGVGCRFFPGWVLLHDANVRAGWVGGGGVFSSRTHPLGFLSTVFGGGGGVGLLAHI